MVVAAVAGSGVEVGGPGVGVVGVAGEVDDGAAQLFIDGPADADDLVLAGLPGSRGRHQGDAVALVNCWAPVSSTVTSATPR
jgi:hypothetical protein